MLFLVLTFTSYYFRFLTVEYLLVIYCFFSLLILAYSYLYNHKPLKKIAKEVAAVLAGDDYKDVVLKSNDEYHLIAHFFNEITKFFIYS